MGISVWQEHTHPAEAEGTMEHAWALGLHAGQSEGWAAQAEGTTG